MYVVLLSTQNIAQNKTHGMKVTKCHRATADSEYLRGRLESSHGSASRTVELSQQTLHLDGHTTRVSLLSSSSSPQEHLGSEYVNLICILAIEPNHLESSDSQCKGLSLFERDHETQLTHQTWNSGSLGFHLPRVSFSSSWTLMFRGRISCN